MAATRVQRPIGPDFAVFDVNFVKGFPALWTLLVDLTPVEAHVLAFLVSQIRMSSNIVGITSRKAIAVAVQHDRSSVGRAIAHLIEFDVLRPSTDKQGRANFKVNPFVACRAHSDRRGDLIHAEAWRIPATSPKPASRASHTGRTGPSTGES